MYHNTNTPNKEDAMQERDTDELLKLLKEFETSAQLKTALEDTDAFSGNPLYADIPAFLEQRIATCGLDKAEVVRRSGLNRTYAYQILQGGRMPSRDKFVALCLATDTDLLQVQRVLSACKLSRLYAKDKRDAVLIFALENKLSLLELNQLLYDMGLAVLE
ncbi:hypothetical protein LJC55_00880 [Eubacteriales bacterium OttesenSCG-928-N14]|nr:hypothetical protein [Eubacteriales bacterium OttesenSCG-928-N14]